MKMQFSINIYFVIMRVEQVQSVQEVNKKQIKNYEINAISNKFLII